MIIPKKILIFLIIKIFIEIKCVYNFHVLKIHPLYYYKNVLKRRNLKRVYFHQEEKRKQQILLQLGNKKNETNIEEIKTNEYKHENEKENQQAELDTFIKRDKSMDMNRDMNMEMNMNVDKIDMDLFSNDSLKLSQWYSAQKVKEKWQETHIDNIRKNYAKVLLNNKYNELFNMYRNVNNNNVENFKRRVKTNRINPSIYIKKRLVQATAKYIKMSFIKTRKILWKIRYMPIIKAFAFLYYYGTNKYTVNIYKCIKSCLYNAINKYGKDNIKPVFHTLQANMGGYTKKINIRAKGKTDIIREPHTHIRVVLEV